MEERLVEDSRTGAGPESDRGEAEVGGGIREQVIRGVLECMRTSGLHSFSLEDVARTSGVSRTSIYRHFPGGRGQLVQETVTWEVTHLWTRVAEAVADLDTLEDRLVMGLAEGARLMSESHILTGLMDIDFDVLADALRPSEPLIQAVMADYMREQLDSELAAGRLRPGVDLDEAADYITRMLLSMMASPAGAQLTDEGRTRTLVRREFLAGISVNYLR